MAKQSKHNTKYNCVLFDMYGTLVDIHTDEQQRQLWQTLAQYIDKHYATSVTPDTLQQMYLDNCHKLTQLQLQKVDYADIDIPTVLRNIVKQLGVTIDIEQGNCLARLLRKHSTINIAVYEGVVDMLQQLRDKGVKILLLSNAQQLFAVEELTQLSLIDYFDGLVISSTYGISKPSPLLADILRQRYDIDRYNTIMVGNDYSSDIAFANNIGIDSIYIHSNISPTLDNHTTSTYTVLDQDYSKVTAIVIG